MRPSTAVKLLVAPYQPSLWGTLLRIASNEVEMFLFVGIAELQFRTPSAAAAAALGALDLLAAVATPGIGNLAALAIHLRSVLVGKLDEMIIEDLPHALLRIAVLVALDTRAHAVGFDGMIALDPVGHVQIMDVLLADIVAGEPAEVIPVIDLVLHLGLLGIAVAKPDAATVPVDSREQDIAVLAVMDLLDAADIARIMTPLQSDNDLQPLLIGQLIGRHQLVETGRIDAAGLLHEDMLAGLDCIFIMCGPKAWRSGLDDHVHTAVDCLLIGVQSNKDVVGRDVCLVLELLIQTVCGPLGTALEGVGHGDDLHVLVGGEAVFGSPMAATAASDQRDLDRITAGGVRLRG